MTRANWLTLSSTRRFSSPQRAGAWPKLVGGAALLLGLLGSNGTAQALGSNDAVEVANKQIAAAQGGLGNIQQALRQAKQGERSAEQRLADATMLMGSKDYARAATTLNAVVEKFPDHPTAYPDGLRLLGETYFLDGQYLSARRVFKRVLTEPNPRFGPYQVNALRRLVDIAMRRQEFGDLDEIFAAMDRVPPAAVGSGLAYARAKALYLRKDYAGAQSSLSSVDGQSEFAHQARYMLGVIAMKQATPPPVKLEEGQEPPQVPPQRYANAINLFTQVTQLSPDTPEHRKVIDQAWLAIGRLFYETDQWNQAVLAYNHIDRTSSEFSVMLYELAWVYVRLGDVDRAQRALEVLAIADPDSENLADGALLRGDLMLRAGQFSKSLKVYEGVRDRYEPMREKVDDFLGSTSDPSVYYDKLSALDTDTLGTDSELPPVALQWAREAEDGPAAFAVIDDVSECRQLLKESNEMIERLNTVLGSPNRVRAFPELKAAQEHATSLLNRTGIARLALGQGMDDVEDDDFSGDLGAARQERRSLEARLRRVPISPADFKKRDAQATKQWNQASQGLQRLTLQVDQLQAIVNGLRRLLKEGPAQGVVRDPASVERLEQELVENERDLKLFEKQLDELRRLVRAGKLQVGFGDQRFIEDAEVRKAHQDALNREVGLAAQGAGGGDLAAYASRIQPLLTKADGTDARAQAALAELEQQVEARTTVVEAQVATENKNILGYTVRLDELDDQARLVVGEVAMRNLGFVRDRLKNIVMRADVGITEQAWEVREEQITRVRALQVERAREDRLLRDELQEVLDDSGESEDDQ